MTDKGNALVTGASRGIGRAISIKLAQCGYHILINYCSDNQAAKTTAAIIENAGGSCELHKFDVGDAQQVQEHLLSIIEQRQLAIDVLVNNAGIIADSSMVWMPESDWRNVLATNLDAFFWVSKIVVKHMIPRRKGRIISIASTAGQTGVRGQVNYSAAKGGLIAASKALAREIASRGITVNVVAPGFVATDMVKDVDTKKIKQLIPMRRLGTPEEIAAAVAFLASAESSYITGQVLSVNGGIYM